MGIVYTLSNHSQYCTVLPRQGNLYDQGQKWTCPGPDCEQGQKWSFCIEFFKIIYFVGGRGGPIDYVTEVSSLSPRLDVGADSKIAKTPTSRPASRNLIKKRLHLDHVLPTSKFGKNRLRIAPMSRSIKPTSQSPRLAHVESDHISPT